jgi:hypothetical protein
MADANLRQIFRKHLPEFDFQSVETWSTGRGVPDLNFCCQGIEGWIELKATRAWRVIVSPEQVGWIERRIRQNGRVFIAVRRQNKSFDELYLLPGKAARPLADGVSRLPALALDFWKGGPREWNWMAVKSLLLHHNFV